MVPRVGAAVGSACVKLVSRVPVPVLGTRFHTAPPGPARLRCVLLPSRARRSKLHLKEIFLLVLRSPDKGDK